MPRARSAIKPTTPPIAAPAIAPVDSLLLFDGAFPVALDGLVALAGFDVDTDDAGEAEDVKPDDRPVVVFNE
jgi:hypothetical protein